MFKTNQNRAVLNRSAFTVRPYRSNAIGVLTTLFHRFPEAGDFEVFISAAGQSDRRLRVNVQADDGPYQQNIDLATLGSDPGCCAGELDFQLHAGGVAGFFASEGSIAYTVVVKQTAAKEKKVLLDTSRMIPAGDLFAVTLVRPGAYTVSDSLNKTEMALVVAMPPVDKSAGSVESASRARSARQPKENAYQPQRSQVIKVAKIGFGEKAARLFAGQTVVFQCEDPAHLAVEIKAEKPDRPPKPDKPDRPGGRPPRPTYRVPGVDKRMK